MLNRNNTSFPIEITNKLKLLYSEYESSGIWVSLLKYYQYVAKSIVSNNVINARGLLLYFIMGLGKTRTAAAIALSVDVQTVVILPKSLQSNFETTLTYLSTLLNVTKKINYVSSDAFNASVQLDRFTLDNSLVIVDEAHNFFKSIINSSKSNARRMYKQIMAAKNLKIIFLTGTPVSKNPFELVPCMNMLHGSELLPSQYNTFNTLYVDVEHKTILNRDYLANRLLGLVSYMTISEESRKLFPIELPTKVIYVEMSKIQYEQYIVVRDQERNNDKLESSLFIQTDALSMPKQQSSSYYVKSRSISNFVYIKKESDSRVDSGVEDDGEHLVASENSPKMSLIAETIVASKGLVLVYSQFVNKYGLRQFALFLKKHGYSEYILGSIGGSPSDTNSNPSRKYIIYTGETDNKDDLITIFNSEANKNGDIIKIILISKTGAEGLDLKNVRETHQIEPYWDKTRENQIKSRAIRYESHLMLPEIDRTVQPYVYISTANKEIWNNLKKRESMTIEEQFYTRAIDKDAINKEFTQLLQDISIECLYLNKKSCYVCAPSNEKLFSNNPLIDKTIVNPCIQYSETEASVLTIVVDGQEYAYSTGPFKVYKFNSILNGYIEITDINILEMIKNKTNDVRLLT